MDKLPLVRTPAPAPAPTPTPPVARLFKVLAAALAAALLIAAFTAVPRWAASRLTPDPFTPLAAHCAAATPIAAPEFHARQAALAGVLRAHGAAAFVAEPGPAAAYFFNVSGAAWHVSERPLLLVLAPGAAPADAPRVSVLTPAFEDARAALLPIPAARAVRRAAWAEEADPYAVAAARLLARGLVFVDGAMRVFVADGLARAHAGPVRAAPPAVPELRARKSAAELALLACANEATLLAIRAVHARLHVGIRESAAAALAARALAAAGLRDGGCLTLFGENAALPHGAGTDRALAKDDFALFDCGGTLHGYVSDVTRTVALPGAHPPAAHLAIFSAVAAAQSAAAAAATAGARPAAVDAAARALLTRAGFGAGFTHRLGHGVGLEGHEAPYLRGDGGGGDGGGGDGGAGVLAPGHACSNEPGVYRVGDVGVRLEDCFYVAANGTGVLLTGGVGGFARSPWDP